MKNDGRRIFNLLESCDSTWKMIIEEYVLPRGKLGAVINIILVFAIRSPYFVKSKLDRVGDLF